MATDPPDTAAQRWPSQPQGSAARYGPWCGKCGHPATYHGEKFCAHKSGSADKQQCDCTGYSAPRCECGWVDNNHYHDMRMGRANA